ncbi:hypothetical protein [Dactylosporangium darangshiense]|uniref:Uncharacterized protein n=1 Tax=Dactylosporangium darangshiense TaxID=579108 RepID=A0ABP8DTF9_9ACTN
MIEALIPAFRHDGEMTTLTEVLGRVAGSAWNWRLLDFDGTSKRHADLDVQKLQRSLEHAVEGLDYSWSALVYFGELVFQPFDATLVASDGIGKCVLVLEVRDSTYWRILADEASPQAITSLERISQLQ